MSDICPECGCDTVEYDAQLRGKTHVGWVVMRNGRPLNQSVYRVKSRARSMATRYGLTYDDVHEAFIGTPEAKQEGS